MKLCIVITPGVVLEKEQLYISYIYHILHSLQSIENRLINEDISVLQEAGHIKNIVILIFRYIQFLHLMNSEVAWVLVS